MVTPAAPRGGRVLARRYHLLRVLGRGAMGAVWAAEDTMLRRTVAVKEVVLPTGLSPEERALSCERTLREARAIARLGHPNVVTLFDVLDEDARPWVVMELVPSRSLADVIKEDGPLHPLRVATIGLAILGALEAAHAASITHRDVKPGNILLGHDGRVKLTDFGIARSAGEDTITGTGLLVGSPSYIAPEIVKGLGAGPPADLWGLGATLYAAAEGRAPFSGGDAMDTLAKVVQEPPAPYERSGPLVPALAAMMEKEPARRARPVDARRLLLDVLRGGSDAEHPAAGPVRRPSVPASSLSTPAGGAAPSALGPALAELLVPVRRAEPPAGGHAAGAAGTVDRIAEPSAAVAGPGGGAGGGEPAEPAGEPAPAAAGARPPPGEPPGDEPTPDPAADPAGAQDASRAETAGAAASRTATEDDADQAGLGGAGPSPADLADAGPRHADLSDAGASRAGFGDARPSQGDLADAGPSQAGAGSSRAGGAVEAGPDQGGGSPVRATEGPPGGRSPADGSPTGPAPVRASRTAALDERHQERLPHGPARQPADRPRAGDADDPGMTVALPPGSPAPAAGATRLLGTQPGPGAGGLDDQPTQVVAPLPFGGPLDRPPDPARPGQPPPPGRPSGPDQPPPPFGLLGERPRSDRRRRTLAALLAVLGLLLAAVVGGVLLLNGLGRSGGGSGTATGAPPGAADPAAIPAGYTRYQGDGFTVGVPAGWTPRPGRDGVVDIREQGSSRFLRLITVGGTSDARQQLTAAERQFAANPAYAPYQQIRLDDVDYRGYDAAEWEFTFSAGGVRRHVLYRGVVTGGRTFGLYLSVPADRWDQSRAVFQIATDTFRPAGGR